MITRLFLMLLAILAFPAAAAAQDPPSSSFSQLGCLIYQPSVASFEGGDKCTATPALDAPADVAVTPDGRQVAVVLGARSRSDPGTNGITIMQRDAGSGALSFASCISDDGGDGRPGSEGICADGDALAGAGAIAFSPDGRFAYVAASVANAVSWFARDAQTGALTPAGCMKHTVRAGERCGPATALDGADAVAVAPDGKHVYVAAFRSSAVTVYQRDTETGALKQQSCVSQSGSDGACTRVPGLTEPFEVSASADGKDVYVLGIGTLATLGVDPATGDLAAEGCMLAASPAGGACTEAPLLESPGAAALSADGRSLLVTASSDTLVSFDRDPATGKLAQAQCFAPPPESDDEDAGDEEDDTGDDEEEAEDSAAEADPKAGCEKLDWGDASTVALSTDGRGVFVGGTYGVTALQRDPQTGRMTKLGCLDERSEGDGACPEADNVGYASALAASADARNLYVVTSGNTLTVLQTTVAIASRTAKASRGRLHVRLACPAARREGCAGSVTGAARAARFKLAAGHSARVGLRLTARQRRSLHRHHRVALKLTAGGLSRRVVVR
jgi:DNA-binding beta-propeller fold protein YncE